jgi:hypothetical protein
MTRLVSYPSKLVGRIEAENGKRHPDHVPAPRFIGDEARARMVMANGAEGSKRLAKIGELLPEIQQPSRLLESK